MTIEHEQLLSRVLHDVFTEVGDQVSHGGRFLIHDWGDVYRVLPLVGEEHLQAATSRQAVLASHRCVFTNPGS